MDDTARSDDTTTLTHIGAQGRARMVDVGQKDVTDREARAEGFVMMRSATCRLIAERKAAKGDVLAIAQVAGIMAAKSTSTLIPLCHPLPLSGVDLLFDLSPDQDDHSSAAEAFVRITATVRTTARTGVEMEALTAVSVAALTIYDMCKAVDRAMHIEGVRVIYKAGGRSGIFEAAPRETTD